MEHSKKMSLWALQNPPRLWRFVDDPFVVQQLEHKENFLKHINSIDHSIEFPVGDTHLDGPMIFLDTLLIPNPNIAHS